MESLQGLMDYVSNSADDELVPVSSAKEKGKGRGKGKGKRPRQSAQISHGPKAVDYTGEYTVPLSKIGKPIYLPSTFAGGPRNMHQLPGRHPCILKTANRSMLIISLVMR